MIEQKPWRKTLNRKQIDSLIKYMESIGMVRVYPDILNDDPDMYYGINGIEANQWIVRIYDNRDGINYNAATLISRVKINDEKIITEEADDFYNISNITKYKIQNMVYLAKQAQYELKERQIHKKLAAIKGDFE